MIIIIVVLLVLLLLLRVPLILVELLLLALVLLVLAWVKCVLLVRGAKRLELLLGLHISPIVLLLLWLIVPVILLLVFHLLELLLLVLEPGPVPLHVEFLGPNTHFGDRNEFFCFCVQWLDRLFSNVVRLLFGILFSPNFFLGFGLGLFLV